MKFEKKNNKIYQITKIDLKEVLVTQNKDLDALIYKELAFVIEENQSLKQILNRINSMTQF